MQQGPATATVTTLARRRSSIASIESHISPRRPWAIRTTARAPSVSLRREEVLPRLAMPNVRPLPPLECCLGVIPSQAAKAPARSSDPPEVRRARHRGRDHVTRTGHPEKASQRIHVLAGPSRPQVQLVDRPVIPPDVGRDLSRQLADLAWRALACPFDDLEPAVQPGTLAGGDGAELRKMPAQRIDRRRPPPDEVIACPVQRRHRLPRLALHRDEAHPRALNRLAAGLGIARVMLVPLGVGPHVLRRHQADIVAELRQAPRSAMRVGPSLEPDQAGATLRHFRKERRTRQAVFRTAPPCTSTPWAPNTLFAMSMPITVMVVLFLLPSRAISLALRQGKRPSHHVGDAARRLRPGRRRMSDHARSTTAVGCAEAAASRPAPTTIRRPPCSPITTRPASGGREPRTPSREWEAARAPPSPAQGPAPSPRRPRAAPRRMAAAACSNPSA